MPLPAQRLNDKIALITGAGAPNSIGGAIAMRFAQEGAKVAILDIDGDGAAQVAEEITDGGGAALAIACDVASAEQVDAAVGPVVETWGGRIEILVNNAALFGGMGEWRPFDEWTVEEWDRMQTVNLRGMWLCARAVYPSMKARHYGKIINVSSSTFFEGVPGFIHYTTSKGGVIGFTRSLARELGPDGIRVNAIAPGMTMSDAQQELLGKDSPWPQVNRQRRCLGERDMVPEDLAGPAVFLASADSDFMTGQTLLVDGGLAMH